MRFLMLCEFDKDNIGAIIYGHGDWFTAQLIRLIAKADAQNKHLLAKGFPDEVAAVDAWLNTDNRSTE
jgi:hypothetical protein